ncbi:SDR family oxidoreductase [Actinacidiphila soli]|uniref:SDR family oxidoreductase n=1 Tax=Actinacidiphila soli TaxID=2487275 RepID=UPI0019D1CA5A
MSTAHQVGAAAAEWAPYNIRVNALAPGYVKTEMAAVDEPQFRQHCKSLGAADRGVEREDSGWPVAGPGRR